MLSADAANDNGTSPPGIIPEIAGIELSWVRTNGGVSLGLFYLDTNTRISWSSKTPGTSWTSPSNVAFEENGNPVSPQAMFSPALVNVPFIESSEGKTCMILSNYEQYRPVVGAGENQTTQRDAPLSLWCLRTSQPIWDYIEVLYKNQSEPLRTTHKPSIVFHSPRLTNGQQISSNTGYLILTSSFPSAPYGLQSRSWYTYTTLSDSGITASRLVPNPPDPVFLRQSFRYYYTYTAPPFTETPTHQLYVSLFEDAETAATKGVILEMILNNNQYPQSTFADRLRFVPFADGTYSLKTYHNGATITGIRGGNDFEIMRKHLCYTLKNTQGAPCAP